MKSHTLLAGVVLTMAMSIPAIVRASCIEGDTTLVRLKIYSPLIMTEVGASTDLRVDANGCVVARYPVSDKRHGVHRFALPLRELETLKRELSAARLDQFDSAWVKQRLTEAAAKSQSKIEYISTDPDIVEIELGPALSKAQISKQIRWTGIDQDLMNHPDVTALQSFAALKARLMGLAIDKRLNMGEQP